MSLSVLEVKLAVVFTQNSAAERFKQAPYVGTGTAVRHSRTVSVSAHRKRRSSCATCVVAVQTYKRKRKETLRFSYTYLTPVHTHFVDADHFIPVLAPSSVI